MLSLKGRKGGERVQGLAKDWDISYPINLNLSPWAVLEASKGGQQTGASQRINC